MYDMRFVLPDWIELGTPSGVKPTMYTLAYPVLTSCPQRYCARYLLSLLSFVLSEYTMPHLGRFSLGTCSLGAMATLSRRRMFRRNQDPSGAFEWGAIPKKLLVSKSTLTSKTVCHSDILPTYNINK